MITADPEELTLIAVRANGEVNDTVSSLVCSQLLFLEVENPKKPISLYINSPGGGVTSVLAVYDTMRYIRAPVHTLCMWTAYSMGSFLLMAGEPGERAALPNASILVHQPSGGFKGQASDMLIRAEEIKRTKQRVTRLYAEHCGRTYEEVERAGPRSLHDGGGSPGVGTDRPHPAAFRKRCGGRQREPGPVARMESASTEYGTGASFYCREDWRPARSGILDASLVAAA